jgi:glycosyltransferase involved in cell wall biosynthesis
VGVRVIRGPPRRLKSNMPSVSFFFSAGNFAEALRRYDEGQAQVYQTHNEVARLVRELVSADFHVNIYSFVTTERSEATYGTRVRIVNLGERLFTTKGVLSTVVLRNPTDAVIAHFPTRELLRAALATRARVFPVTASSDNRTGLRAWLSQRRYAALLNHARFELVANHCFPATEQLARFGVRRDKLIAWDVHHPMTPASRPPKSLRMSGPYQVFYAGSINENKGIGDLIRAIALLTNEGIDARCSLAGGGEVEAMAALSRSLGIQERVSFLGLIPNTNVLDAMARADIVAVPSRARFPEGFPLTLFEAIASRTPIVCSDHPMFCDVLIDRRNASVFRGGDPQSLARALRQTLTEPELYASLSSNAQLTWAALQGPADWRTLMFKWLVEGPRCQWIQDRLLSRLRPRG